MEERRTQSQGCTITQWPGGHKTQTLDHKEQKLRTSWAILQQFPRIVIYVYADTDSLNHISGMN